MDEQRARAILDALGHAVPEGVLLWRGEGLDGSDVDVVVLEGNDAAVARALRDAGLTAAPQDPGHVLWRLLPGETVVFDVLAAHAWPRMYPPLDGVVSRSGLRPGGLRVASVEDRLLIHAAEAVAGWPIEKVLRKVRSALAQQPPPDGLVMGARPAELAALVRDPDRLASRAPQGRLGFVAAVRAGARSPTGRAALRVRAADRVGIPVRPPLPSPSAGGSGRPGLVVALSGMDGAGKSTAALEIAAALEEAGRPVVVFWTRLAGDPYLLEIIGRPVKRLLRRSPAVPGAPDSAPSGPAPALERQRSGLVNSVWVAFVAAESVRTARRAYRLRRRGLTVVCDRWAADALVDLHVRYGDHAVAGWVLRRGFPRPDLSLFLEIDPATAAARKPGDQPVAVLEAMAGLYDRYTQGADVVRIDASRARGAVAAEVRGALRSVLERA